MCFNCGCGKPNEDYGKPDMITEQDFEKAAKAAGQTVMEAKRNTFSMLQKQLSQTPPR